MDKKLKFKLAMIQAQNIINMYSSRNKLIKLATNIYKYKKKTKNFLKNYFRKTFRKKYEKPNKLQTLVHVRGGIGDVAATRIFIKKLRQLLPNSDIFFCYDSKAVVDVIFPPYENMIDGFISKKYVVEDFDIIISGAHVFIYKYYDIERIEKLAPDFLPTLKIGLEKTDIFRVIDENTPYLDGYLANVCVEIGMGHVEKLGYSAGFELSQNFEAKLPLVEEKFGILKKFNLENEKYITIHNGISSFTATKSNFLTRTWTKNNWKKFVEIFKKEYPDIKVVQIGGDKAEKFEFVDISLINQTKLEDIPYILEKSLLHIDGEGGIVHIANLLSTKSIVMFSPTRKAYFAYDKNINIEAEKCYGCMHTDPFWMSHCVLGFDENNYCLATIAPESILSEAKKLLIK